MAQVNYTFKNIYVFLTCHKILKYSILFLSFSSGDVHISTGAISDLPDVAIEGPNKLDIFLEKIKLDMGHGLVDSTSATQLLFVFGGGSEPGLISEIQDPIWIGTSLFFNLI